MATLKFTTPITVGDLNNSITVDSLELVSISINFQPVLDTPEGLPADIKYWRDRVIVSCMLWHPGSDWIHTVTLGEHTGFSWDKDNRPVSKGAQADAMWAALKKEFPNLEKRVLELLAPHLPPGEVS